MPKTIRWSALAKECGVPEKRDDWLYDVICYQYGQRFDPMDTQVKSYLRSLVADEHELIRVTKEMLQLARSMDGNYFLDQFDGNFKHKPVTPPEPEGGYAAVMRKEFIKAFTRIKGMVPTEQQVNACCSKFGDSSFQYAKFQAVLGQEINKM